MEQPSLQRILAHMASPGPFTLVSLSCVGESHHKLLVAAECSTTTTCLPYFLTDS